MNIILGASGQVGSAIINNLLKINQPVKGIVRKKEQAEDLEKLGAEFAVGDAHDLEFLIGAFAGGNTLFVLTPEDGSVEDVLGDTKILLENYKKAVQGSSISKIVGLSSMGAQIEDHSGNLKMSYMLEHEFLDLPVQQIFVRPAYYFSNWLLYIDQAKETGILNTFYPPDLKIPMIAPTDVAELLAKLIAEDQQGNKIYEIEGPEWLSTSDIAHTFSKLFNREIKATQIPRPDWEKTLAKMKFSPDGIKNFIEMTETVNEGKSKPEKNGTHSVKGKTSFETFIKAALSRQSQS
jgi:uncharacterized protein YbjT (DUF2867 family)